MVNIFFQTFQFSLVQLAAGADSKDSNLAAVRRYCPSIQTDFWRCMNKTLNGKFDSCSTYRYKFRALLEK